MKLFYSPMVAAYNRVLTESLYGREIIHIVDQSSRYMTKYTGEIKDGIYFQFRYVNGVLFISLGNTEYQCKYDLFAFGICEEIFIVNSTLPEYEKRYPLLSSVELTELIINDKKIKIPNGVLPLDVLLDFTGLNISDEVMKRDLW